MKNIIIHLANGETVRIENVHHQKREMINKENSIFAGFIEFTFYGDEEEKDVIAEFICSTTDASFGWHQIS
jgi:hypothetical protein